MTTIKKVDVHPPGKRVTPGQILDCLRQDPGYVKVGATAGFTGIVRGEARDGTPLKAISIKVGSNTQATIEKIAKETETKHDIIQQCAIHIHSGDLDISEPLMMVFLAGIQGPERVPELFDILVATVERIKREANIKLVESTKSGVTYETKPKDPTKSFD